MMKEVLKKLFDFLGDFCFYNMCEVGEIVMWEKKGFYLNLDYYAVLVYYMFGILILLYMFIFFSVWMVGLCVYVIEQYS